MTITIDATYANGVFQPKQPVKLAEGTSVHLTVQPESAESRNQRFRELVCRWKEERGPTSSIGKMATHPAYREIVNMGTEAVPLLLSELERQPDHWFMALSEITGVDPVPNESFGRLQEMTLAWLRWGKEHGFVS